MRSLRSTLLVWLLPPLLVVGIAAVTGAYLFMNRRLTAAYDLDLGDIARAIVPMIERVDGGFRLGLTDLADRVLRADSSDQIYYAVRDAQGKLVAGDSELPLPPRPLDGAPLFWNGERLGLPIRAVALDAANAGEPLVVVAAETTRKRERAARDALVSAAVPAVLLQVAAIIAVLLGVRQGLAPLEALRMQLQQRSHLDLRPVERGPVAEELQPLVGELNEMLARLDAAQHTQTRFIANAAHQLRTPIAGLLTQLELAQGAPAGREGHLRQAHDAAQRLARLARQVLSLAAADPISNPGLTEEACDLASLVRDNAHAWVRQANGVELSFELQAAPVRGNPVLLGELASNLVDNATRYGALNVHVATGCRDARAFLEVSDDGPGIPMAERERIFERFHRLDNQSTEGSGLGLAIVREIAQRHGAEISVNDGEAGRGARIEVSFPARS